MPSTLSLLKTLAWASTVAALPKKRDSQTLHLDVVKASKAAQAGTVNADFTVSSSIYYVEFTLGTPPQTIYSQLDTGSSNLVVYPPKLAPANCGFSTEVCSHSTYTASASSTFNNLTIAYSGSYGDGEGGSGFLVTDTLNFEGAVINAFEFVDQDQTSTLSNSVFGTGYKSNEGTNPEYDNLPLRLVDEGYINSPVFSLWLNSLRSTSPGSMLYGGIDNKKYCGNLATLPIQQTNGGYTAFAVQLGAIVAQGPNGQSQNIDLGSNTLALLDSGTNSIAPSQTAYNEILALYNAAPAQGNGFPKVDCSLGSSGLTMSFTFAGGLVIPVPLSQIVAAPQFSGQSTCDFFIGTPPTGSEAFILGSSFLSAAYVVYDLGNNEIHMAPAIFDPSSSNVVAVGSGPNAVPSLAGPACSASTTTTTSSTTATSASTTTSTTTATTTTATTTGSSSSATSGSTTTTATTRSSSTATSASTTTTATTGSSRTATSGSTTTTGSSTTRSSTTGSSTTASSTSASSSTASPTTGTSSTSTSATSTSSTTWSGPYTTSSTSSSTWSGPYTTSSTSSTSWNWSGTTKTSSSKFKTVSPTSTRTSTATGSSSVWPDWTSTTTTTTTPAAVWSDGWEGYPVPTSGISYSTVTTTVYVCPAQSKYCAPASRTPSVTTATIPYTTSTVWTTVPVTITVSCPPWASCTGGYVTTSWTASPISTTVCPWTGPASVPAKPTSYATGAIPAKPTSYATVAIPAKPTSYPTGAIPAGSSTSGTVVSSSWADAPVAPTSTASNAAAASSWADAPVAPTSTASKSAAASSWADAPLAATSTSSIPAASSVWSNISVAPASATSMPVKPYAGAAGRFTVTFAALFAPIAVLLL